MLLILTCDGFILTGLIHFSQLSYFATIHRPYLDFTVFVCIQFCFCECMHIVPRSCIKYVDLRHYHQIQDTDLVL